MRHQLKRRTRLTLLNALAFVVAAAFLFPYLFMVMSAFKSRMETFAYPPVWIFRPTLEHFRAIFADIDIMFYMKNSTITAVASTLLTMLIAIPATYSFARFRFPFKEPIAYGFLFLQMVPGISIVFSLFFVARSFQLYDTRFFLVLCYLLWNVPYAIWMLRGFVEAIPVDLEEAAMVDGCSRLKAFVLVTLPLMAGGLAASAILVFIGVWNEFALAFFLTSVNSRTMPTTIAFFMTHSGIKWGPMFATATLGTLPVVIFALIVRRYFVSALTFGAVKG
ncbi:MAG TPA: carbohydrate ABC transporter permease [Anaerolineae bacterium]|nr:carbohydrate ABC transporter permease [Anaerolineae bacterium]HOQ98137.1 carbohydrate ABC transporter permease [Anaerolineae bacterium]HPL29081.1 carbohydrate ABC transporter permease [Anaerolineae bacterium]